MVVLIEPVPFGSSISIVFRCTLPIAISEKHFNLSRSRTHKDMIPCQLEVRQLHPKTEV